MFRKFSRSVALASLSRMKHDSSHSGDTPSASSTSSTEKRSNPLSGSESASPSSSFEGGTSTNSTGQKDGPTMGNAGTEPLFAAMKEGNFTDMQNHATAYFQQRWKEEYNLPAGLVIIALVVWYWMAWTNRSIKRKCAAMESATEKEVLDTLNTMQKLVDQFKSEMVKASTDMKLNMAKNAELIADIDRMTAALRSCQVRPQSSS